MNTNANEMINYKHYSLSENLSTKITHHRMGWLRLIFCGEKLLSWCRASALPPLSMVVALQSAQLDPAVELFYPDLSARIATVLQVPQCVYCVLFVTE